MIYILVALKSEAQAFVDKYKLKKEKLKNYTFFTNNDIKLIVTGVGIQNMQLASQFLCKKYSFNENDKFLNIGICGANKNYKIGTILQIGNIEYKNQQYSLDKNLNNITCLDKEMEDDIYNIVDMESYGFYNEFKNMKYRYIFKVVSDHFEPKSITKDKTKTLIFKNIDNLMGRL